MENSYRIHTQVTQDTVLNVNMTQDMDFLEILSLKLSQSDAYKLFSSNYGVIVGRVLANDAFGIPNAKISMFIERDSNDSVDIENIYPYSEVSSNDSEGRRYNLLPDYSDDDCYRVVGTFPQKRLVLDDDTYLEIYDKYWKYSTVTNNAGDYMLFGVPSGNQQIHIDMDLSDIGILSQKPRDFEYKGYNLTLFDNANQFKESTNLDGLAQIFSQNQSVFVYPFWGDADNGIAAITRSDVQIQYKFEPTCVFMGCIVSDNEGHAIGHRCSPSEDSGLNTQLVAGNGTIEMIRKTTDGLVEEFQIQGNQLIDEDGVWCYQIPMNLDYIGTDEYGNIAPTDNPNKGIPTRAQVRFRFSKTEMGDEGFSRHTAKYLVPQNPIFSELDAKPRIDMTGAEVEKMYNFGSATPEWCFRDLYWNNVYSVKNYIPRTQTASRQASHEYTALKGANLADDQNPIPFNKLRIDMPFMYMLICIIFEIIVAIMCVVNGIITLVNKIIGIVKKIINKTCIWKICPLKWILGPLVPDYLGCLHIQPGMTEGNVVYFPCCSHEGMDVGECDDEGNTDCPKSSGNIDDLIDKIQRNLAVENKLVKLDLYQDWINGCLYMPLWYWRKRKKKSFLFGLITSRAKSEYCSCEKTYSGLRLNSLCDLRYTSNSMDMENDGYKRWQSYRAGKKYFRRGLIKPLENKDGLTVYYYAATQATTENSNPNQAMENRPAEFYAVRLFATDIILLGNLDENNLYGVPQFFKALPSTTANIPPMATTVEEPSDEGNEEVENAYDFADGGVANSGQTMTTGMDWWHNGNETTPQYKRGLFMDLACTVAYTRQKSCINAERLAELGVNLDTTYSTEFNQGSNVGVGTFEADGFISKLELEDTENRAMFASMNHIGFVPQTYQETHGLYETQVIDPSTGYFINKFKYIYPVDFDGKASAPMKSYRKKFKQAMVDTQDESYLTFRLGAENNKDAKDNAEQRIRHFYYIGGELHMPLYNNSYYFYFGINKGSTAIDKFKEKFFADCYQNTTNPFTLDVDYKGVPWCPQIYTQTSETNKAYGYIRANVDDIRAPYTYALYDSIGSTVISESGMTVPFFVIGGKAQSAEDEVICNENGAIFYQTTGKQLMRSQGDGSGETAVVLENQTYTLELVDSDGKVMTQTVDLQISNINASYTTLPLGTKFYNVEATPKQYICDDAKQFYGQIQMTGFTLDGYECKLIDAKFKGTESDGYVVAITGAPTDTGSPFCYYSKNDCPAIEAILTIQATNETTEDCLCTEGKTISGEVARNPFFLGFEKGASDNDPNTLNIYVYQPQTFIITIMQSCNGQDVEGNASSTLVSVENGENFNTFLNEMPTRFMLSSPSFYNSSGASRDINAQDISGWFSAHTESPYSFVSPSEANESLWSELVDLEESITEESSKWIILQNKFNWIFNICEAAYVTNASPCEYEFTAEGGVQPTLFRTFAPYYEEADKQLAVSLFTDDNYVEGTPSYPFIVGSNYIGVRSGNTTDAVSGTSYNPSYTYRGNGSNYRYGNFFAAFTNNGGYTGKTGIDNSVLVLSSPEGANVVPRKAIGEDIEVENGRDSRYNAIWGTNPYLRAIFLDRRLDYNLVILPPYNPAVDLYNDDEPHLCYMGRISGYTYNGIEMSYDENYNIITEPLEVVKQRNSGATEAPTLEYSYDLQNTKVIYNPSFSDDPSQTTVSPSYPKRYYDVSFYGIGLTDYVWSDNTKAKIVSGLTGSPWPIASGNTPYVFHYPQDNTNGQYYNGDFTRDNYPTKRYIDITNISGDAYTCMFHIGSCGYNINTNTASTETTSSTESGETAAIRYITGSTKELEEVDMEIGLQAHINIVQNDNMKDTDANLKYTSKEEDGDYMRFEIGDIDLSFNVVSDGVENHDIYVKVPRLINLFPFKGAYATMDAVTYLKTANDGGEYGIPACADNMTLDEALSNVGGKTIAKKYIKLPSGYKIANKFALAPGVPSNANFIKNGTEWATMDELADVKFRLKGSPSDIFDKLSGTYIDLQNMRMSAVLLDMICIAQNSTLTQTIRLVQPTQVLDMRDVKMRIVQQEGEGGNTKPLTYITKQNNGDEDYYTQVITIDMLPYSVPSVIQSGLCQTVCNADGTNDAYTYEDNMIQVVFSGTNVYTLDDPQVSRTTNDQGQEVIRITCPWTEEMDYLGATKWKWLGRNKCQCLVRVTTPDGVIYRFRSPLSFPGNPTLPKNVGESVVNDVKFAKA